MKTALLLCLAQLFSAGSNATELHGKVAGVSDGVAVMVLDAKRHQHKVRLAGIDALEKTQAFSQTSKRASRVKSTAAKLTSTGTSGIDAAAFPAKSRTARLPSVWRKFTGAWRGTINNMHKTKLGKIKPPMPMPNSRHHRNTAGCGAAKIQYCHGIFALKIVQPTDAGHTGSMSRHPVVWCNSQTTS